MPIKPGPELRSGKLLKPTGGPSHFARCPARTATNGSLCGRYVIAWVVVNKPLQLKGSRKSGLTADLGTTLLLKLVYDEWKNLPTVCRVNGLTYRCWDDEILSVKELESFRNRCGVCSTGENGVHAWYNGIKSANACLRLWPSSGARCGLDRPVFLADRMSLDRRERLCKSFCT